MDRSRTPRYKRSVIRLVVSLAALGQVLLTPARGQDGNTSLQGMVEDLSGARIPHAEVTLLNPDNGFQTAAVTDGEGRFSLAMLSPGRYALTWSGAAMAVATQTGLELHVGGPMQLLFRLRPAGRAENITVVAPAAIIDPESGEVSQVIDEQSIAGLPLNGRRYTDLALLSPGVTQDPRGLTSDSNGDLSYGGIRGYQNSSPAHGADNNNSFIAPDRGRYRAPYQFSNEVIKELRVSINSFESEASSIYHRLALLLKGQISRELFVRVGYTFAEGHGRWPGCAGGWPSRQCAKRLRNATRARTERRRQAQSLCRVHPYMSRSPFTMSSPS